MRKKHQKIQRKPDARAPGVAMEARELRARMLAAGLKPETLAPLLDDGAVQTEGFDVIHRALRQDASQQAADAVLKLVGQA